MSGSIASGTMRKWLSGRAPPAKEGRGSNPVFRSTNYPKILIVIANCSNFCESPGASIGICVYESNTICGIAMVRQMSANPNSSGSTILLRNNLSTYRRLQIFMKGWKMALNPFIPKRKQILL